MDKHPITIFWLRRDLRLHDNSGLYYALKSGNPVLCLFIFDKDILDELEDKDDARVTFIHQTVSELSSALTKHGSTLLIKYNKPLNAWEDILQEYNVTAVYANRDYEPYAKQRDGEIGDLLKQNKISFQLFKDQVIFER